MPFRFRRGVRLAHGVRLNIGRRGLSASIGGRGARVSVGPGGTRATVSTPVTGISYRGGRPIRAKTYVSVLHAMLWVGLAAV
jgi:Protein of unknown function (DUF4236)